MTWTVTSHVVPFLLAFVAGWFSRGWWEWRAVAKAAARAAEDYDPYDGARGL